MADTIAARLDRITSASHPWWATRTWEQLLADNPHDPLVLVLANLGAVLRRGEDPEWVVGNANAQTALEVAREWLFCDINPFQVALWLRAGCQRPESARLMLRHGIAPDRLLGEDGEPNLFVSTPDGRMTLAAAVVDRRVRLADAVQLVRGQPS